MRVLTNIKFVFALYVILAIIVGIQQYLLGSFNNFLIFQQSVFHFFNHQNLYLEYPKSYFDVFLYNPTFSIFFIPFAYFPLLIGIPLWTLFVTVIYFLGINSLGISSKSKLLIFYFVIPELITSIQNLQTNPLIASFIVLSMTQLDVNRFKFASAFPSISFYIKGYGAISGIFFLLKSPQLKTFLFLLLSFLLLGALPLLFYSVDEYIVLYQQWWWSLTQDYKINVGISAMGFIKSVFYEDVSIIGIQLIGVVLFAATFLFVLIKQNYDQVKYLFLSYILIWVIIFNQSSESPTYIIASTGVLIWFATSQKTWLDVSLFILFFIFTLMSPSDLFPSVIRKNYVIPYSLKALPCILVWLKITITIFFQREIALSKRNKNHLNTL